MFDVKKYILEPEALHKQSTKRSAIFSLVASLVWFAILSATTWIVFFKPLMTFTSYKVAFTADVLQVFNSAKPEGSDGRIRLEQMTHQDSGVANVILQSFYRFDAIKNSGIDLKDPNADLSKVDTRKIDELVLQATREYTDFELKTVLEYSREIWDESLKPLESDVEGIKLSTSIINKNKIDHLTTLSQGQKNELATCYEKLEDKLSNPLKLLINIHSIGTCSPYGLNEPTFFGTYTAMFKVATKVDSDGNEI